MSLLLDALKKSEAQRRRGTAPTIDLSRTPPSGTARRPARRWLFVALAGVLLVAAAPWLWPQLSEWFESRHGGENGALAEATPAAGAAPGTKTAPGDEGPAQPAVPAPVAGAANPRRAAAADPTPAVVEAADSTAEHTDAGGRDESLEISGEVAATEDRLATATDGGAETGPSSVEPTAAAAEPSIQELQRRVRARQQQQQQVRSAAPQRQSEPQRQPQPTPSSPVNEPTENFIRPWELPQAQRAEFPELSLTVHFYAERAADRFVLINGERYREGQRVGPGTRLAEIRQRGAVVEFGSYRVLIE